MASSATSSICWRRTKYFTTTFNLMILGIWYELLWRVRQSPLSTVSSSPEKHFSFYGIARAFRNFVVACGRRKRGLAFAIHSMNFWPHDCFLMAGMRLMRVGKGPLKGRIMSSAAVREGEQVNVEVTTLAEKEFNPGTISRSLRTKRRQLPRNAPAVIVVSLPLGWVTATGVDWNFYLMKVTYEFFGRSERSNWPNVINGVVYFLERLVGGPGPGYVGGHVVMTKVYPNPSAEIKMNKLDFLFNNSAANRDPLLKQIARPSFVPYNGSGHERRCKSK